MLGDLSCQGHFLAAETFLTTGATVVARLSRQLCIQSPMKHPLTPDKRYLVVRGRLWRAANPALSPEVRKACVDRLMTARRAVRDALQSADDEALAHARTEVDQAKVALGERGPVWWTDGAPDLNRQHVKKSPYADWLERHKNEQG